MLYNEQFCINQDSTIDTSFSKVWSEFFVYFVQ